MDHYVHHVPGRLRVRVPSVKGNAGEASSLEKRIRSQRGVKDVQTNPLTGSVLVHYDPVITTVSTLSQIMLCSAAAEPLQRILPAAPFSSIGRQADQSIASRIAATIIGLMVEIAMERAAVALLAAVL